MDWKPLCEHRLCNISLHNNKILLYLVAESNLDQKSILVSLLHIRIGGYLQLYKRKENFEKGVNFIPFNICGGNSNIARNNQHPNLESLRLSKGHIRD